MPLHFFSSWSFGPDYNNTDEDCLYLNIYSPNVSCTYMTVLLYTELIILRPGLKIVKSLFVQLWVCT